LESARNKSKRVKYVRAPIASPRFRGLTSTTGWAKEGAPGPGVHLSPEVRGSTARAVLGSSRVRSLDRAGGGCGSGRTPPHRSTSMGPAGPRPSSADRRPGWVDASWPTCRRAPGPGLVTLREMRTPTEAPVDGVTNRASIRSSPRRPQRRSPSLQGWARLSPIQRRAVSTRAPGHRRGGHHSVPPPHRSWRIARGAGLLGLQAVHRDRRVRWDIADTPCAPGYWSGSGEGASRRSTGPAATPDPKRGAARRAKPGSVFGGRGRPASPVRHRLTREGDTPNQLR